MKFLDLFRSKPQPKQEVRTITKDNCPFGDVIYTGMGRRKALSIPAVYAAVTNVADTLSTLEVPVYRWNDQDGAVVDYDHPVYRLLNVRPNPLQTAKAFRYSIALDLQLEGEAVCEIVRDGFDGTPLEVWRLDPQAVSTQWDANFRTLRYYVNGREIDPNFILHVLSFSMDGFRGCSPFDMCKDSIELTTAMNTFGQSFFQNSARPGGFLTTPPGIKPEDRADARKQWNESFSGSANVGKTPALPDGFAWNKITVDPEEGQFNESRVAQLRECQRITRTPPSLTYDYERQVWANIQYSRMDFVQNSIRPLAVAIEQAVNKDLLRDDTMYAEHKLDDLLRGSFSEQVAALSMAVKSGIYTSNEAREVMGLPAHQDGEKLTTTQENNGNSINQQQPQQ
jgi:HK97 family phage portal protein